MVGFPNKSMGFPTKNDRFGVEIGGVPPFKETPKMTFVVGWRLGLVLGV